MGVGKTVKIDKKWRILIPKEIRKYFKIGDEVMITLDKDGKVVIKKTKDWKRKIEEIKSIKLKGDKSKIRLDAAKVKDEFGGKKQ